MPGQRKLMKVYREEVKERYTTHWDLDDLRTADLEAVMGGGHRAGCPKQVASRRAIAGLAAMVKRMLLIGPRLRA